MALQPTASAPTDFDFVLGDWLVRHRRLKERMVDCQDWVEFEGEMSTQRILGGFGNIEDNLLRFPGGEFRAVALRSFDPSTQKWSIWWLDGRFPGTVDIPVTGAFENGIGTFFAEDSLDGKPILIRFIWSRSSDQALRWEQAFSSDNGQTWETNWTMDFTPKPQA